MKENNKSEKESVRAAGSSFAKHYMQPAFLICAAVLAVAGGGMSVAIKSLGIYLEKEHLPLRKPLDLLDEKDLAPYMVISKEKIENEEIIKNLGAEDYIQWILEDLSVPADSTVRYCSLFVTYYGLPGVVLHVPEECYLGSGYGKPESGSVTFKLNKEGGEEQIPGKYLVFSIANSDYLQENSKFTVLYLFNVNGSYTNSGQKTRAILNKNLFGKYSYFCKVEWKFFSARFVSGQKLIGGMDYPNTEEAVAASGKLLNVILPILEKEHWPIWGKTRAFVSVPGQAGAKNNVY